MFTWILRRLGKYKIKYLNFNLEERRIMKRKTLYMIAIMMVLLYIVVSKLIMPINNIMSIIWMIIAGCIFIISFFCKK